MNAGLTPKNARLLALITELTVDAVAPSYEVLAETMCTSKGSVHRMLTRLQGLGLVTWDYGAARSLRLTDPLAGQSSSDLVAMRDRIDALLVERMA